MKNKTGIKLITVAATLAFVAPVLADTSASGLQKNEFSALSSIESEHLVSLTDAEMDSIKGEFFDLSFLSGINIAIMPQINICVICSNTNQFNNGLIIGFNFLP